MNINPNKYPFNNTANPGADFTPYNELLEWEISTMSNYGVDADFFNNKLSASFDFFNKRTTGIYLTQEVPGTAGIGSSLQNVGEVENKGWELTVSYRGKTGPVNHTIGANLSDNLNRVIRFGQESIRGADYAYIIREGFPYCILFRLPVQRPLPEPGRYQERAESAVCLQPAGAAGRYTVHRPQ